MIAEPRYKVVNDTSYQHETPDSLIRVLEEQRQKHTRLIFTYGNIKTLEAACTERGRIGRSTGTSKIPLLIKTVRSVGGVALVDSCILSVQDAATKRFLWTRRAMKEGIAQ